MDSASFITEYSAATVIPQIASEISKLFTFQVSENVLTEFGMVMNRFLSVYTDKVFHSLEMLE